MTSLDALRAIAGEQVSRETFDRVRKFSDRFMVWNARINLASETSAADLWSRHIFDSAQLNKLDPVALHWLDLGSGGGFPGVVVALLLRDRPGATIDLVESNRKKAGFLQAMIGEFDLPAKVHAVRIEQASDLIRNVGVVTARAVAPLDRLLLLSLPWLGAGAKALFHKGRDYRNEIADCDDRWQFDLLEHPSVIDRSSAVLQISRLRLKEAGPEEVKT